MSRPRMPNAVAEITGAAVKDPQRFRDRKSHSLSPLGPPPKRLNEDERAAWDEMADEMPWLARSDRKIVEVAARLMGSLMCEDARLGLNTAAQLRLCFQTLGGTPADRSKVNAPDEPENDEASEFLN